MNLDQIEYHMQKYVIEFEKIISRQCRLPRSYNRVNDYRL